MVHILSKEDGVPAMCQALLGDGDIPMNETDSSLALKLFHLEEKQTNN